jgi:hypothetical protein
MTSEYVLRKNRKKGGKSTRGPPGIGFNLTENGDYDIAGHKLVNVKQPENPGDAVNLQYLASANDNMIKKDDSESVLKIVKPELSNMIKKDDSESVLKIVKPELSNMIKKDDSESVLKIVRRNLDSLNLSIRKNYIGVGNRRIVKTADAIDKYDVVNKGQLDIYGERLINLETDLMKKTHYSILQFVGKIQYSDDGLVDEEEIHLYRKKMLDLSFDGEIFIRIPMDVEVIKFYSTAILKDLDISTNKGTIDLSKPFIVRESDLLSFKIKIEKVNTDESLGGYNHNKPYLLSIPIFFYMLVKFSL